MLVSGSCSGPVRQEVEVGDIIDGKALVRRFVDEVMNRGRLDVLADVCTPDLAVKARAWIEPFRGSFSDVRMEIVALVAEGDTVVGRFRCSGTHTGVWLGRPPTGRRFRDVDEVSFFTISGGRISAVWGLEDTEERLRQLFAASETITR